MGQALAEKLYHKLDRRHDYVLLFDDKDALVGAFGMPLGIGKLAEPEFLERFDDTFENMMSSSGATEYAFITKPELGEILDGNARGALPRVLLHQDSHLRLPEIAEIPSTG